MHTHLQHSPATTQGRHPDPEHVQTRPGRPCGQGHPHPGCWSQPGGPSPPTLTPGWAPAHGLPRSSAAPAGLQDGTQGQWGEAGWRLWDHVPVSSCEAGSCTHGNLLVNLVQGQCRNNGCNAYNCQLAAAGPPPMTDLSDCSTFNSRVWAQMLPTATAGTSSKAHLQPRGHTGGRVRSMWQLAWG